MKKLLILIILLIIFVSGCSNENDNTNNNNNNYPNHYVYYFVNDYDNNTTDIFEVNVSSGKETKLITVDLGVSMIKYDDNKLYAIFNNRVGYIKNNSIEYITTEDEYVARFDVKDGFIYYGKDNNNGSDNIFEQLAMKDIDGENEKIISSVGISQLVVDDYIYYKPNSGTDISKLVRYNLDGSEKTILFDKSIGQIIKNGDYIYYVNYNDEGSVYKIKYDGTNIVKMIQGPINFSNSRVNQVDGYTNMSVIDDYLYYIDSNEGHKLYKTTGDTRTIVIDASIYEIYIEDEYIYCKYSDYNKPGVYLLDKTGKELKQITDKNIVEYIVR